MADAAKKESAEKKSTEAASAAPKKKDFVGLLLLVLAAVNLVALGGAGFYMYKLSQKLAETKKAAAAAKEQEAASEEKEPGVGKEMTGAALGVLFPLEGFLVNITSEQGTKFLQLQMELELGDAALEEELTKKKAAVRDGVIVLLTSRTYKELREPNGIKKLRGDLLKIINNLLTSGKVKDIFFTQFHFN